MALTIYPDTDYDSLISISDSSDIASNYSVHSTEWLALSESIREVYLRIATGRIFDVIDSTLLPTDSVPHCVKKATTLMAVKDFMYGISSEVNPNTGAITKEKVGDIEVTYAHGNRSRINSKNKNPFPSEVITCLNSYGANLTTTGFTTATLVRS